MQSEEIWNLITEVYIFSLATFKYVHTFEAEMAEKFSSVELNKNCKNGINP